jgi:UDP-N-acetylglucosamine--N-acetylmuramyl-(pentapeptide) pyrophosphoryl-undecaprenol N-acetylglucosamine transferase
VRSPLRMTRGLWNLWRGSRIAKKRLDEDRPDAVFATGGYAAAPVGRAARAKKIPLVLFLPDVRPGWAVRLLQRSATMVTCAAEGSLPYLPESKTVVTGYPVRRQFLEATREDGIRLFELAPGVQTLLIAGGSMGAHQINIVVREALPRLLERMQIIHISGRDEYAWLERERSQLPVWQQQRYRLHAYTEEMAYAMAASDLAVMRAGASTLGELPALGLPAILIPGGFSEQNANAAYLANRGAAIALPSVEIGGLADLVIELLDNDVRRAEMAQSMRVLGDKDAAASIAAILRSVAS